MSDHVLVESRSDVATITLNRPEQRNAISFPMWGELTKQLTALDADKSVRAIVITGAGERAFCAGADISDFDEYRADAAKGRVYNATVDELLKTLSEITTPTISMIRGFAIGGGCELAVATDLRVAAADSRFGIVSGKPELNS